MVKPICLGLSWWVLFFHWTLQHVFSYAIEQHIFSHCFRQGPELSPSSPGTFHWNPTIHFTGEFRSVNMFKPSQMMLTISFSFFFSLSSIFVDFFQCICFWFYISNNHTHLLIMCTLDTWTLASCFIVAQDSAQYNIWIDLGHWHCQKLAAFTKQGHDWGPSIICNLLHHHPFLLSINKCCQ